MERLLCRSYGFVEEGGDIFLLVAMGGAQYHDTILDGQSVQMVQHDVVWLR